MVLKRKFKSKLKEKAKKGFSVMLAIYFFCLNIIPNHAYALTGGPSQPEVQSFEPIGTSDMVDLFSGDFVYNIPLLDVEGYPINLSYHSGITMDQEASWVGLGWNINPGVINRGLRGIPDDFNGEVITNELSTKPNRTIGANYGLDAELFGLDKNKIGLSLGASLGVSFNNYVGIGTELGLNVAASIGKANSGSLTGGLGLNSSSGNGLTVSPSLSLSVALKEKGGSKLGLSVGSSFNSRSGMQQLTINTSLSFDKKSTYTNLSGKEKSKSGSASIGIVGTSFNFGQPTFTPQIGNSLSAYNITLRFNAGAEAMGLNTDISVNAYYSEQSVATPVRNSPAYGYFNLESGQGNNNAILDFNREKDGSFTETTPALPLTNLTYDIFSVSGQGVGGSYRAFRNDIGYVYDPYTTTTSSSFSAGAEVGVGAVAHSGGNIAVTASNGSSGKWTASNVAAASLKYRSNKPYADYERFYLKEANEKSVTSDPNFMNKMGGANAVRFDLINYGNFNKILSNKLVENSGNTKWVTDNQKQKREKRSQLLSFLSKREVAEGMGLENKVASNSLNHHLGEITTLNTDGSRYVYGLPLYNILQEEVTFSVGSTQSGTSYPRNPDLQSGLIEYTPGVDNTSANKWGVDNYFSKTTTPPYAHSYLLTAVLSNDYIDSDGVKGPTDGDFGTYTKFSYTPEYLYKWRTPVEKNKATYNEGLNSLSDDDKANYIYGEKNLRYLEKIETKNYVAIFETIDRDDAQGVDGSNGGTTSSAKMKKLNKISLYTKREYTANPSTAIPIKEVHFVYDYSLCTGVSNSSSGGKLTLKQVYFTYRESKKGKLTPYKFTYAASISNPGYNLKGYDRWGNYKPQFSSSGMSNADYPYVLQDNPQATAYAEAWSLKQVDLPSGGKILVEYEPDDYAYVQNKKAMQMFKITGVSDTESSSSVSGTVNISDDTSPNKILHVELDPSVTAANISEHFSGINYLYFRCLMNFGQKNDYVSGYAEINSYQYISPGKGIIKLKGASLGDENSGAYNPIAKAGIQYGRLYLSKYMFDHSASLSDNQGLTISFVKSLINTFGNFADGFKNPNQTIYDKGDARGRKIVTDKSWVRLNNVNGKKIGGGVRVKKLRISDEWSTITDLPTPEEPLLSSDYGQEYEYTTTLSNGKVVSSGVAAYEPQIGGDENPWKQPVFFDIRNTLVPDDKFYQEEPYGESFFPSAAVGYSEVKVKNLTRNQEGDQEDKAVTRHATGFVVNKFYTAKDFPTITSKTALKHYRDKSSPFSIFSLFSTKSKDYMTASQGFAIETNDMHGKPKSVEVYPERATTPISSMEYRYKSIPYLADGSKRLSNSATVISKNGTVSNAEIGVHFDMVGDMRDQQNVTISPSTAINLDVIFLIFATLPVPMIWPNFTSDEVQFRSSSVTKVVQRFGILDEVIAKDLGSIVKTKNLAYDAETGEVILNQTTTNFNDEIYTLNYPAYWYYDAMGMAYQNIGFTSSISLNGSGESTSIQYPGYFTEGDELMLVSGSTFQKGWISEVNGSTIKVVKFNGQPYTGTYLAKVTRSGRRNMTAQTMANITTLVNPLNFISSNLYEQVIQASAIEFGDGWKTHCDCFEGDGKLIASTNPYIMGTKGIFKPKTSYLHLTNRTQDNYDGNTNIRKDGIMTSYTPFYRLNYAKKWEVDKKDWTYTSEVTEFNPFGQELENRDALGRFSAATFGFNQTMATAVAANAQYKEVGYDGFEDYGFSVCADNHFKFNPNMINIDNNEAHTGFRSVKVTGGTTISLNKQLDSCNLNIQNCVMDLAYEVIEGSILVQPIIGTPNYIVDYDIVNGEPVFDYNPLTYTFTINTAEQNYFTMVFSYTDAKGCSITKTLVKNGEQLTFN